MINKELKKRTVQGSFFLIFMLYFYGRYDKIFMTYMFFCPSVWGRTGKVTGIHMAIEKEDIEYRKRVVQEYKPDVERLIRYLPWLEEKSGAVVSETFSGSGIEGHSIPFPVYDSTLLGFIKEVQRTNLVDRNYVYIYSRYRMRTHEDERKMIEKADITQMDILKGILSKYVMGGMTKGRMWSEAVEERIFLGVVKKMKENLEFWDRPMT